MKKFTDASGWILLFAVVLFSACNNDYEGSYASTPFDTIHLKNLKTASKIDLVNKGMDTSISVVLVSSSGINITTMLPYDSISLVLLAPVTVNDMLNKGKDTAKSIVVIPSNQY